METLPTANLDYILETVRRCEGIVVAFLFKDQKRARMANLVSALLAQPGVPYVTHHYGHSRVDLTNGSKILLLAENLAESLCGLRAHQVYLVGEELINNQSTINCVARPLISARNNMDIFKRGIFAYEEKSIN